MNFSNREADERCNRRHTGGDQQAAAAAATQETNARTMDDIVLRERERSDVAAVVAAASSCTSSFIACAPAFGAAESRPLPSEPQPFSCFRQHTVHQPHAS